MANFVNFDLIDKLPAFCLSWQSLMLKMAYVNHFFYFDLTLYRVIHHLMTTKPERVENLKNIELSRMLFFSVP